MRFSWPSGVDPVPEADWTDQALGDLALGYDTLEHHGWYANLDRSVDTVVDALDDGDLWLDYSGGTGILADRVLERLPEAGIGVLIVDSSRKFLRLALDKLGNDPRVGFRRVAYLKDEDRVQTLGEALEPALMERGAEVLTSTNAIHLYTGLDETLGSWHRMVNPGGRVHVQSGNIGVPDHDEDLWIIDDTVHAIAEAAIELVREDPAFEAYREALTDEVRMRQHRELRDRFFLPVRPLDHYTDTLAGAGFEVDHVDHVPVEATVEDWFEFLAVYDEAIVGWVGGTPRVEGHEPAPGALEDRKSIMRAAMDRVFDGKQSFRALWTYIDARRA